MVAIAVGGVHTCGLTTLGGVLCWGDNAAGAVGDGTTTNRPKPTPVSEFGNAVTSVTPASGGVAGGTAVTVKGTAFKTGAVSVLLGGTPATDVLLASPTTITAVAPAHAAGPVDIVVTDADHRTATLAAGFTYAPGTMSGSPSVLEFGTMPAGSSPVDRTLTVTNTGEGTLSGWSWSFGGLGNPVGGTCGSAAANPDGLYSLTPGQSCTFVLRFTPSSLGQQGGALSVGMRSSIAEPETWDVTWTGSWTATVQAPPPAGAISGTVTDANTGAPLAGLTVQVYSASGTSVGSTTTDAMGVYIKTGLATGTYYARTSNGRGYVDEFYRDVPCPGGACRNTEGSKIVVVSGATTSGVDFALPAGGSISGVVSDTATGQPLQNVTVTIYVLDAGGWWGLQAKTDEAGRYTRTGLSTGTYYVRTSNSQGYVDELYADLTCTGGACSVALGAPVAVTTGVMTNGIDFGLVAGGAIAGAVTSAASGEPLGGFAVRAYNPAGTSVGSATTNTAGAYSITGLATGTYYLQTSNTSGYIDELYSDMPCTGGACTVTAGAPVSVSTGVTTAAINFGLAVGGTISGVVTNADSGEPLIGVTVRAYNASGTSVGSATTNAAGAYAVSGLATGTYYLRTSNGLGFLDELYADVACTGGACAVTSGAPVAVTASAAVNGIDFGLAAGGTIAGQVTNAASGAPVAGVSVRIYNSAGTYVGSATTNAAGAYEMSGLAAGTYYVQTSNTLGYIDELYGDTPCTGAACAVTSGTPVSVATGTVTNNIDVGLALGGVITGLITDATSAAPLRTITVHVYNAAGNSVGSVRPNSLGMFEKAGLAPGNYYVRTMNSLGYIDQLYNGLTCAGGSCPLVTTGTGVSVTAGATTSGIEFALGVGGSISGTVTDAGTGSPLSNVTVQFFDAGGTAEGSATTDASGNYSKNLLPAGTHYAVTVNSLGYIDELYDNLPCSGCAVTSGTGITVAAGATTSGVSFGLMKVVSIAAMTVSPDILDFGAMPVGSSPVDRALTVTNTGTVTLSGWYWTLNTALVGGTCGSAAANPGGLYSLTPGQSCTFVLRFTPDSLGSRSAPLWIGMRSPAAPAGEPDITWNGSWTASVEVSPGGGDFTGDGKADILWRHDTQGDIWLWEMNGDVRTAETYVRTIGDTNWEIRAVADFTGDRAADLLWRNKVTGELYLWPMDGAASQAETYVGTVDPAYDIVGTGDFDGDGKSDMLWRHTALGDVWVWLMDGATPKPGGQVYIDRVDPAYVVKGVADLDANGKADIVWHHATTGEVWAWPMNGTTRLDQMWVGTVPDTGYQVQAVADFTGDGKADLVWWHATRGEVWVWTMNGTTREAETWVGTVPDTNYQIAATGNYNGDGQADLLWRSVVNGEVWMWLMDGTTRLSETWVATVPDTGYRIIR